MKNLIDKLEKNHILTREELITLLTNFTDDDMNYLAKKSSTIAKSHFKNEIYTRALIEISSICKNDCYYCGIRKSNKNAQRYRLTKEQILECCQEAFDLEFRTFVLQGGEDGFFTDDVMVDIISDIKQKFPECALTLSIGERSFESYQRMFNAGADRYLLRHETITKSHYEYLHPQGMTIENRVACLHNLKKIGYQVGCGIMVGSPNQTIENIADDLIFIHDFNPHMVGIGPFIPHHDTPFRAKKSGSVKLTLFLLGLIRLISPTVLLPATTALGSIEEGGRERGILMGANVVMPNFSPQSVRDKYSLYDNKLSSGKEAGENKTLLAKSFANIGYCISNKVGNWGD